MPSRKRFLLMEALLLLGLISTTYMVIRLFRSTYSASGMYAGLGMIVAGVFVIAGMTLYKHHVRNRELFDKLRAANRKLRGAHEKDVMMNRYLSVAAHDIRNPLQIILSCAEMLKDKEVTSGMEEELAGYIEHAGERILTLVEEMLDIQKMEESGIRVHFQEYRVHEILDGLIYGYRQLAAKKKIRIRHYDDIRHLSFLIDKSIFLQTADNLISNAVKYSPPDTVVTIRLESQGGDLILTVSDQGPGIPAGEMSQLFKRFPKVSTQPTGEEVSTGLGLSIVREHLDAMGGEIWCESEPGEGAMFVARFPKAKMKQKQLVTG